MKSCYSLFLPRSAKSLAWLAILVVFTISILALIGWFLDISLLQNIRAQWIGMSVITATCLILAGVQLMLLQVSPSSLSKFKVLQVPAALVSIVGLLTVALYSFVLITGQEPSLGFAPFLNLFWAPKTRLALLTAINFLVSGIALALLANGGRRAANIAHTLMLPGAMISYLVPVSYLLGIQAWHGLLDVPMALNTGLAFSALSVAIFCVRPDTWLMVALTSDQAGGIMARRLLPAILMIPLMIGWLRLYGERTGAFVSEVGVVLVAVAYTFSLLCLVLLIAASLNRADSQRRQVEEALVESYTRFEALMNNSPAIAWAKDETGRYVYLSKACENRFGIRLEDCRAKTDFDLWPQAIAEKFRKNDLEVLASGQTTKFIEENVDPDGRHSYWWNFKFPFSDAAGGRYIGGVGVDITERKQAEEALQEREAKYRAAIETSADGFCICNLEGRFLECNDSFAHLLGYSRDELLSMTPFDIQAQLTPEEIVATIHQVQRDGQVIFETWHRNKDGRIWPSEVNIAYWPIAGGRLFVFMRDITERKQAEETLRQSEARERERAAELQGVLDAAPSPIFMAFSQDVKYMIGNPAAYELLRLPVGSNVSKDAPDEDRPGYKVFKSGRELSSQELPLQRAVAGEIVQDFEFELALADGTVRQVSANAVPLFDELGAPRGGVTVLTDLTAYKKSEEALRQAHDELERRVKDRTAELERVNKTLQQSEENLRFLTSQTLTAQEKERKRISYELHEGLGQSLTVLKMHLRDIQRMMPPSGPERDEFESVLNYMNNIVEDIRRLSKDLSPLMLEDLGLPAALKNLFEETCKREGKDCYFKIEDIHTLLSPEEQLIIYRVSQEILNNVIKHAQATRIEVVIQRLNSGVQFSVADNGVGFDVDQTLAGLLKDRGMGLAYMKEQVRMLGGAISISSKVGEGTRINITVPIRRGQLR